MTTRILNGRNNQASEAQPNGAMGRRSEIVTVALLAAAVLLWILAAVGRAPSKISTPAGAIEYRAPLTPQEIGTLGTKVTETATARGITDPEELGTALERAYSVAVVDKSRRLGVVPLGTETWGADFADSYFENLADEVVKSGNDE